MRGNFGFSLLQKTNEPCVGHEATDAAFTNGCHNAVARSTPTLPDWALFALNPYSASATVPSSSILRERRGWRYFATMALFAALALEVALLFAFAALVVREKLHPSSGYVIGLPVFLTLLTFVSLWGIAAIGLTLGLATQRWWCATVCLTIPMLAVLVLAIFGSS